MSRTSYVVRYGMLTRDDADSTKGLVNSLGYVRQVHMTTPSALQRLLRSFS